MRWEYRRLYVPFEVRVEAGKRPEIKAFMLGTPKEVFIFPEEVDRARSA